MPPAPRKAVSDSWVVPGAIVFAGVVLAIAVYVLHGGVPADVVKGDPTLMRPVDQTDHILGSPAATVKLVEYADIDSPYSKTFQATMEQVMSDYAAGGKVAWVYRHLPLVDQHPNAETNAEAAECAASIGGPNTFWKFIDAIDAQAPGSVEFDPSLAPQVATSLGLLQQSFTDCMQSHTYEQRVSDDFQNGLAAGADGSPYSILLIKGQPPITIDGSVPYDSMKKILDAAIQKAAQ